MDVYESPMYDVIRQTDVLVSSRCAGICSRESMLKTVGARGSKAFVERITSKPYGDFPRTLFKVPVDSGHLSPAGCHHCRSGRMPALLHGCDRCTRTVSKQIWVTGR